MPADETDAEFPAAAEQTDSQTDSGESHLEADTTSDTDTEVDSVGRRAEDTARKEKEPGRYEAGQDAEGRPIGKSTPRDQTGINPGGGGHSPKP